MRSQPALLPTLDVVSHISILTELRELPSIPAGSCRYDVPEPVRISFPLLIEASEPRVPVHLDPPIESEADVPLNEY